MKINVRILLITISVVVLISAASILIFYSLTVATFKSQHYKSVLNSSSDFNFLFQQSIEDLEDDFQRIKEKFYAENTSSISNTALDFIFTITDDSLILPQKMTCNNNVVFDYRVTTIRKFMRYNPDIILDFYQMNDGSVVYYGKQLSNQFLNELAKRIRAEIALIRNEEPVVISHEPDNHIFVPQIKSAMNYLSGRGKADLYEYQLSESDFIASYYLPHPTFFGSADFSFIIFLTPKDAVEYQGVMRIMLVLIVLSGFALSIIFVLLFTGKLRKQITLLNDAARAAAAGDLETKVEVITHDEIGNLGMVFNSMLDQIKLKEKVEKDYAEFIALINQTPTLKELADSAIDKIISITGMTNGVLYLVENFELKLLSTSGLGGRLENISHNLNLYQETIHKKKQFSLSFDDNPPVIKTGLTEIKLRQLLIFPVIYNKKVIAVIELASTEKGPTDIKSRIERILEQFAIGLMNARSFERLEHLVNELQILNQQYLLQNEELTKLHEQIKTKADELEVQRSKAVELTKLKSQFLATVSHELKTPLNAILGLTELIIKDPSTISKSKNRLNIVFRNGKKLLNLINNILDFSKLESGKIELNKESFLLKNLLQEIELFIESLLIEKEITFKIECENSGDILLNTDRMKLEQILINLLSNAVKFTEQGIIKLEINLLQDDSIKIVVSDTGIGISRQDKEIIFDEFRQADGTTSRKFSGTGLGLAICKKYVELLNGDILLESTVGVGTVFIITIPGIVQEKVVVPGSPRITLDNSDIQYKKNFELASKEMSDEVSRSIMIVDDDEDTLYTVGEILSGIGFETSTYKNGIECLLAIKNKIPDLILLDIMMPQMDGFETIKQIRKDIRFTGIPIIALTAYAMLENKEIVEQNGFTDIIPKPIESEFLIKTVKKYILKNNR